MFKISFDKIFTIILSIFYILGLCANFYDKKILFSSIVLGLIIGLVLKINLNYKKAIVLFLVFIFGFFRVESLKQDDVLNNFNLNNVKIFGVVDSPVNDNLKNKKLKFFARVSELDLENKKFEKINSRILITLDYQNKYQNNINIGDYFEVEGKIRSPLNSKNPYQFDYKKYLENNNVSSVLYGEINKYHKIKEPKFNLKNKKETRNFILREFELKRNKIIEKHSENIHSPRLEILGGIVFGNETINPDEDIKESFKNSGLLHLLAASGLNVALIYGIWWWVASFIRLPYVLSILTGATLVIFYTFMTGFGPSIVRASLMLLFILFGKIIDRQASSLALIFFVGFLMLVYNPKMLFDVGFQLSFMVTIGLICCCPVVIEKFKNSDKRFIEKIKDKNRILKYFLYLFLPSNLISLILIPLVAQLFAIPLQIHYFHNVTPYSVLANVAVVPFIGILSFVGFLSSILALIPYFDFVVKIFDMLANPLLGFLIKISNIFSSFKYSIVQTNYINIFQMFSFWFLLLLVCSNIEKNFKNKKNFIILILLLVLNLSFLLNFNFLNKNLEIIMFDVENADSFLIKTPENKYFIIDTGRLPYKGYSSGEMIVNQYLRAKRINTIEKMIITHFDSDHCGGTIDILKNRKVKQVIIKDEKKKNFLVKNIIKYLKENKVNYSLAQNNSVIYEEKDLKITNFITRKDFKNDNENSIMTLLTYKDKNILFMADCGILAYQELKNELPKNVEIIKIGHHGAKNVINQEMINVLKPEYALISTGINKYNHPHYSTINLLEENEIKTMSTKNYGFVKLVYDNEKNDFSFYHFNSKNKDIEIIDFLKINTIPFHKSKYVQDFIIKSLQ